MKRLLPLLIIVLTLQYAKSQNAYYDALFLNTLSEEGLEKVKTADGTMIFLSEEEKGQIDNAIAFMTNPFQTFEGEFDVSSVRSATSKYNKAFDSASPKSFLVEE